MAKSRRTEKQQLIREYESALRLEKESAEKQQRLEKEAEDLYWALRSEYEDFKYEQEAKRQNLNEYDDCFPDFDSFPDYNCYCFSNCSF